MSRKNKMGSKKWIPWIYRSLITFGLLAICYPFVSQIYYQNLTKQEVSQFEAQKKGLEDTEIKERMELAHAYNNTLTPAKLGDPFTKKKKKALPNTHGCYRLQKKSDM